MSRHLIGAFLKRVQSKWQESFLSDCAGGAQTLIVWEFVQLTLFSPSSLKYIMMHYCDLESNSEWKENTIPIIFPVIHFSLLFMAVPAGLMTKCSIFGNQIPTYSWAQGQGGELEPPPAVMGTRQDDTLDM